MSSKHLASSTHSELRIFEEFDYMDLINNLHHFDKLRIDDSERSLPTRPPSTMYSRGDHAPSNHREAAIGYDHFNMSYFHETRNICAELPVEKNEGVKYQNWDDVPYLNFESKNKNGNPNNDVRNNQMSSDVSTDSVNNCSSSKRKREKSKVEEENKPISGPRCNCTKSECLDLSCECFTSGMYCGEDCGCTDCFNNRLYEDTVEVVKQQILSHNPSAFATKKVKERKTIASSSERRGCNCIHSKCRKKYCPCFQAGVPCTEACHCQNCQNPCGIRPSNSVAGSSHGNSISEEMSDNFQLFKD
ncbi:protein tesmin/TSO1-like CXC 2 [Benincasa hispida]|uniref:protein tesmin/TSO1-like CXC 2 n=1 Tax=Benincasa hispida TaxID=102211 RepID=UPI0019011B5C|nr:protein tesmin/TSO1-like CXC 2 [Benincasa hispida]